MSEATMIKEFLVGLGFKIDGKGQKDFADGIAAVTVKAVALGAAVQATASAVTFAVAKIADGMESLYFASQRTKASVENIQAAGFAAGQLGSNAEASQASLESLARFMRTNPGAEGLIGSLGIQTRDANKQLRDTTVIMAELGKTFVGMPYYRAKAYADVLGIDEKTLMALQHGLGEFSDEYRGMLRAAGVDSQEAAKSSHAFMNELRTMGAAVQVLVMKVGQELTGKMGENIKKMRERFVQNFDTISAVIVKVAKVILGAADVISALALRAGQAIGAIVRWFDGLDPSVKRMIALIGGLVVAWKLLNTAFMASPIGKIVALGAAILLLYDDYQTWKEGGQSLIDWSKWEPYILKAIAALKEIALVIGDIVERIGGWQTVLAGILAYMAATWVGGMVSSISSVLTAVTGLTGSFASLSLAAKAGMVAAAGAAGYAIGTELYDKKLAGTKTGDAIGKAIAHTLAFFGDKDARDAIGADDRLTDAERKAKIEALRKRVMASPSAPGAAEPRGIRNNNPGNIDFAGQAGATREDGPGGRFARWATPEEGLEGLSRQIQLYAARGIDSVRAIIAKWAPENENNTKDYIETVAKRLGVTSEQHLDLNDPKIVAGLMDAITRVENGKNPYSAEMMSQAATATLPGQVPGATANFKQETHITVSGAADPARTASAIGAEQNSVNARLVRNMKGAVS